jgi:hypothetical protein
MMCMVTVEFHLVLSSFGLGTTNLYLATLCMMDATATNAAAAAATAANARLSLICMTTRPQPYPAARVCAASTGGLSTLSLFHT